MPLDEEFTHGVVFIVAPRLHDGVLRNAPIGTGFFVRYRSSADPTYGFLYVVTARHVVEGKRELFVRVTATDGGVVDLPSPDWILHPTTDVAAAAISLTDRARFATVPDSVFMDALEVKPLLGDTVFFIGLLAPVVAMGERNVPMVRSGTLGATYQERVPIRWPDGSLGHIEAHLIDCRAYRGFSGSPCYVQFIHEYDQTVHFNKRYTALLGVVSAHFDHEDEAFLEGDLMMSSVKIPIHSGVGVVVPVEAIREVLNDEEFTKMRDETDRRIASGKRESEVAATADSLEPEFQRFEDLTRRILIVPKDEIDEKRREP